MIILLPIFILVFCGAIISILAIISPKNRFTWLIGLIGSIFSLVVVSFWLISINLNSTINFSVPKNPLLSWSVNENSWLYAICFCLLTCSIILIKVKDPLNSPVDIIIGLSLNALAIFAVTTNNPINLAAAWISMDLIFLIFSFVSTKMGNFEAFIYTFSLRMVGIILFLFLLIINGSNLHDGFQFITSPSIILILLIVVSRIGVFSLNLLNSSNDPNQHTYSIIHLITATSGLFLLLKIPPYRFSATFSSITIMALSSLFLIASGLVMLFGRGEKSDLSKWIVLIGFISVLGYLTSNNFATSQWVVILVLSAGFLSFFPLPFRTRFWLRIIIPSFLLIQPIFFLSNFSFPTEVSLIIYYSLFLLGYSIFLTSTLKMPIMDKQQIDGIFPQYWTKSIVNLGIFILPFGILFIEVRFLLSNPDLGVWWASILVLTVVIPIFLLRKKIKIPNNWEKSKLSDNSTTSIISIIWSFYRLIRRLIRLITTNLEGDGGFLWSLVILVLLISIILQVVRQ